ncbi:radical SAM protein [Desulfobacula sp.]|uniref:radical SAM protein n=1 Tax=Desulfobacula sp. TaxID=2593537 RepID=UPI002630E0B2|nr:radical SAM protein [Desulfobacula sp.]
METNTRMQFITTSDCLLEEKKNDLLAAVYEKDYLSAEQVYTAIFHHAANQSGFNENFEKRLHQIQTMFNKFKPALLAHCSPDLKDTNKHLNTLILNTIKCASGHTPIIDFPTWETILDLDPCQKDLLYQTAMTFQLTSGCSNYCRRCNEWALPKVRSHFSFNAVLTILNHMAEQKNDEVSLYGASDPLDWTADHKTLSDIIDHLGNLSLDYSILTKAPKAKASLLKRLLKTQANLSVSITAKNKARIQRIEGETGIRISKQHDLDALLIPARLDEDFISIKPSITDGYGTEITPDGAFIIIPTFTSALHPFGHKKIPVTKNTRFFPVKKTGRKALLVDYFKPLEVYDLQGKKHHLAGLLDVQIESIILDNGTDQLTPPGMRSLKEYLSIFEENPRLQRKKMTPSVMKRLKKRFLFNTSFKNLSQKTRSLYLKKIHGHLNLCKKKHCLMIKMYVISFFLESIHLYQQHHPVKVRIMQFLLKNEIQTVLPGPANPMVGRSPEAVLMDPDLDTFHIFRCYLFRLLDHPDEKAILEFIHTYPAAYDPVSDVFTAAQSQKHTPDPA